MKVNCKRKVLFISQLCYFRYNDKYRLERFPSQFGYKRKMRVTPLNTLTKGRERQVFT